MQQIIICIDSYDIIYDIHTAFKSIYLLTKAPIVKNVKLYYFSHIIQIIFLYALTFLMAKSANA